MIHAPEPFKMINPITATDDGWTPLAEGAPVGRWIETMREGEGGTNVCMATIYYIGEDPEWSEREGGRTTVTHHSFAPPTHWRFIR